MSKTRNDVCTLKAVFTGGDFDGEWWVDRPDRLLVQCRESLADSGGQTLYAANALYRLIENGPPLKYEVEPLRDTPPN
jgi:hypothetical protein